MIRIGVSFGVLLLSLVALPVWADLPSCNDDQGNPISMNDTQVLQWKQTEPNGWRGRGNIDGTVINVEPDQSGHNHFIVQIGPNAQTDIIELIYNYEFGALPEIDVGMEVQACGDFIQSNAQNGPYAASPAGAILHWVHGDPRHHHPDGYVAVNGTAYGFDFTNAGRGGTDY